MKCAKLLVLSTFLLSVALPSNAQNKVEIFYETLNGAARKFFVEQYQLVSANLLDKIDLRLYPYGNTVKNDDNTYTCPFEGTQCEANKIHACVINAEILTPPTPPGVDSPLNQTSASAFVNCFFKNRYADDDIESLGEKCLPPGTETDWAEIRDCILEDATVVDLFGAVSKDVEADLKTDGLVVRIGGIVNVNAKTNLLGAVCAAIANTEGICAQAATPAAKVKIGVYYEAQHPDAGTYLAKQMATYYHVLEDFVDIELYPYGNTQLVGTEYNCSLGNAQCISNKFQALVVDKYINNPLNGDPVSGPNRAVNFISCLFQSTVGSELSRLEICSNQKLEADEYRGFIEEIKMNGDKIKTVFKTVQDKTALIATGGVLPRVPTITVNDKVDYSALDDLVQEACVQYTGVNKASICTKANLTILYEPLNHKSRTLFLEQIKPVFSNLYNLINLQMIPAGRAILAPGHGFVCPGGADQCDAMKLQACAIDYFWNDGNNYTDPIRQEVFDFIVCTFKNKRMLNVFDAAELCSEDALPDADAWVTIHACLLEGTADAILNEYIKETQSIIANVADHSIPIVLINGNEVADFSTIKKTICGLYDEYHQPDYCQIDMPAKVQIQVFYESMSELSKYFFTTQYGPWYLYIEEMANLELLPAGNVVESTEDGNCDSYEANSTCLSNKIQAFVIDKYFKHDDDGDSIDGTLRTAQFLECMFGHPNFKDNVYAAAEYCTEEKLASDEWFDLLTTVKSEAGATIYKAVLDATKKFKQDNSLETLDPVPWVTLDNQKHSKRAADDLLKTVCSQYPGDKPPECTPVKVEIYYSAINPQSRRFFLDQLIPIFRNLRERIEIDPIVYGVANPDLSIEQECSSKDNVCKANKAQACAINKFFKDEVIDNSLQWDGKNQTLSFIYCMFKNIQNDDIPTLIESCANNNIILADEITQCMEQSEGLELLSGMRNRTLAQFESMEHAPWIVINGLRSAGAESDLKTFICNAMIGDKPDFCYNPTPAKVKIEFHYSTFDNNAQSYVISELYPHYRLLEEIMEVDVVPFGFTEVLSQDDGNYTLICPNGVDECHTNLIHACVYGEFWNNDQDPVSDNQNEYDGRLQVIEFINCYFSSPKYPGVDASEACVESVFGDIYSSIKDCAQSDVGRNLLIEFGKKVDVLLPRLTYIPWMTVSGKHNYAIERHIQRTVCNTYTGAEKPQDCYAINDQDPKPEVAIHYEIGDTGSKDFFANLLPDNIADIADVQLVPFGRSTYTDATNKKCVNNENCAQYKDHACLLKLYLQSETVQTLKTIACTFGDQMTDPNVVNECVNQQLNHIPDAWEAIQSCVVQEGEALLKANSDLVSGLAPKISHMPWVLISDEHNIEAEVSLVNEICAEFYPAYKPALCQPKLLEVGVYYETVNTNSASFFLNQLSQYTEYLDELGQFTFVPYGTTKSNGNQYTCTEGDKQCRANVAHACVLNRYYNSSSVNPDTEFEKNRIRAAGFLECTFFQQENGQTDPVLNAERCLELNFEGDLWRDIHYCMIGPDGDALMKEMARKTAALNPPLTSAPVVTIGSQVSPNALNNFFQYLCNSYGNVKAPLCATLPSLAVKVGVYFSANADSQAYFKNQLLPFYKEIVPTLRADTAEAKLHTIISPDLVAWGTTKYDANNAEKPFTCDGQNECYINRFFACANHFHGSEPRAVLHQMELALCFFTNDQALTNPQSVFNNCTNRIWIPDPYVELELCATTNEKQNVDIFLKAKTKTENNYPALTSFPAITINNIRDEHAEQDLLASACYHYQGYDRPADCEGKATPSPVTTPSPTTVPGQTTAPPTTEPGQTAGPTTAPPTTEPGQTEGPTTLPPTTPGDSGTTCAASIFVLFVSFLCSRFLF